MSDEQFIHVWIDGIDDSIETIKQNCLGLDFYGAGFWVCIYAHIGVKCRGHGLLLSSFSNVKIDKGPKCLLLELLKLNYNGNLYVFERLMIF